MEQIQDKAIFRPVWRTRCKAVRRNRLQQNTSSAISTPATQSFRAGWKISGNRLQSWITAL